MTEPAEDAVHQRIDDALGRNMAELKRLRLMMCRRDIPVDKNEIRQRVDEIRRDTEERRQQVNEIRQRAEQRRITELLAEIFNEEEA